MSARSRTSRRSSSARSRARGAFAKPASSPRIDHVVFGNVLQTSADAIYGARHVGLKAGVPVEVPALTVNRLCGSGFQAVVSGAQMIQLGEASLVLTGGIESMSQAPHVSAACAADSGSAGQARRLAVGSAHRHLLRLPDGDHRRELRRAVRHHARGAGRLRAAQPAARRRRVERRAASPTRSSRSRSRRARASQVVDRDDHLRPETTLETLAKLPPAFKKDGTVTAGNASGIVDGGAALILASRDAVERIGCSRSAVSSPGRRPASSRR